MGQRNGFSFQDIDKINRMYNCNGFNGQGNNFQGQLPSGPGNFYGQSGYGGIYNPSGPGVYPSGPSVYPSGPYYPFFDGKEEEEVKEVSENIIEK